MGRAERKFREAFARLKIGRPELLPKGTKVTQNNVAREAGVDPSALRRSRFQALVADIQAWGDAHTADEERKSPRQRVLAARARNKGLRERLAEVAQQRDLAAAKVILLEEQFVALTIENERLKTLLPSSNVSSLRLRGEE
jgi:hypothetical protein